MKKQHHHSHSDAYVAVIKTSIKATQVLEQKSSTSEFFRAMVQAYRDIPASMFPTSGVIRKSGNYGYLALDGPTRGRHYITTSLDLMTRFRLLQKIGVSAKTQLLAPQSPTGAHVTLRNVQQHDVGKKLDFTLDHIVSYDDDKQGHQASGFNPHVYPLHWFVLRVKGIPQKYSSGYDPPHISLAILAYVK